MRTETVNILGALVIPRLADDLDAQLLDDAFAAIGRRGPHARTPLAALKSALLGLSGRTAGQTVVPLEDATGYAVTKTAASLADGATAAATFSAHYVSDPASGAGVTRAVFVGPESLRDSFYAALRVASGQVARADAMRTTVAVLGQLGATRVTENGGIYWLPDCALDEWEKLSRGVQAASAAGATQCYTIRTVGDAESIRAISDLFATQIDAEIAAVERDLAQSDTTDRVWDARTERIGEIQSRIALYERELGSSLDALRQRAERATTRESQADILTMHF